MFPARNGPASVAHHEGDDRGREHQGGSGAKAMAQLASAKPDGGMFYATTPTFIYTSLMSKPAAT